MPREPTVREQMGTRRRAVVIPARIDAPRIHSQISLQPLIHARDQLFIW